MGSFFAARLAAAGLTVLVSDRDTPLSNAALAARCELALVAVPLRATPAVLAEMAPHVPPGGALASLGSLMEPAAEALGGAEEAFLLHPLFGPGRKSLRGARLAVASLHFGRPGPRQAWLLQWLRGQGAGVVTTTPAAHDRTMAVAQALLHGGYAALTPQLAAALPSDDPLAWASPTLRLQLALMSRILHQDAGLYGDLLALNRHARAAIDALIARLEQLRAAAVAGPEAAGAFFGAARDALGPAGPALAEEGDRALGEG
jgi:prephenate dehydrogenase